MANDSIHEKHAMDTGVLLVVLRLPMNAEITPINYEDNIIPYISPPIILELGCFSILSKGIQRQLLP